MLDENAKSHVGFDWSGRRVAIVGYGSQGRAHALNLRDSGVDVVVGARVDGPGWARATEDGFQPQSVGAAVCEAELVAILTPDLAQPKLFLEEIQPNLADGATVLFAHGFCVRFGFIEVPTAHDLIMVAPKAPGPLVRREFERGFGVPCLVACENDASGRGVEKARGYAHCLGGTRAGLVETDFAEETETDLFGEQAVLCGGVTELIAAGFETLTEAGYRPEVAYFECLHELKLIVDLLYEGGFERMHDAVSDTASYGDLTRGARIVNEDTRARMREILAEIKSGAFAKEWLKDWENEGKNYRSLKAADLNHPIEETGKRLRSQMAWLNPKERSPA